MFIYTVDVYILFKKGNKKIFKYLFTLILCTNFFSLIKKW